VHVQSCAESRDMFFFIWAHENSAGSGGPSSLVYYSSNSDFVFKKKPKAQRLEMGKRPQGARDRDVRF
jgi:hypothetical protein